MLLAAPVLANASLMGATMTTQYYFGGGAYGAPTTFVVNGGVDASYFGYFNVLVNANTVTFDFSILPNSTYFSVQPLSLAPTIHNGLALNLGAGVSYTGVALDPASNLAGFTSSNFSFTANQIQVDFQGLSVNPSTIVTLDVNTSNVSAGAASIPEPAGLMLVGLGLLALSFRSGLRRPGNKFV